MKEIILWQKTTSLQKVASPPKTATKGLICDSGQEYNSKSMDKIDLHNI